MAFVKCLFSLHLLFCASLCVCVFVCILFHIFFSSALIMFFVCSFFWTFWIVMFCRQYLCLCVVFLVFYLSFHSIHMFSLDFACVFFHFQFWICWTMFSRFNRQHFVIPCVLAALFNRLRRSPPSPHIFRRYKCSKIDINMPPVKINSTFAFRFTFFYELFSSFALRHRIIYCALFYYLLSAVVDFHFFFFLKFLFAIRLNRFDCMNQQ